jgi:hypothetical protein
MAIGAVTETTDPRDTPPGKIVFTFNASTDILSDSQGIDFCGTQAQASGACGA